MQTSLSPEIIDVIQKGAAYRELAKSEGYRLLLEYLNARVTESLQELAGSEMAEDRYKLNLQMIWRQRGKMLQEMQTFVAQSIQQGMEEMRNLAPSERIENGLPFEFGEEEIL